MFDVFFISYHEQYADENFEVLKEKAPLAKRVDGVKGIFNAHKRAAELSKTKMFYVIDADAILLDEFNFDYQPTELDEAYESILATDCVHTWRAINPINDLVYGYGGAKLFPAKGLREAKGWNLDFTTSVVKHFKPMLQISNITAFNTDPYSTWKSAFRECSKLASSIITLQLSINTWIMEKTTLLLCFCACLVLECILVRITIIPRHDYKQLEDQGASRPSLLATSLALLRLRHIRR